MKNNNWIKLSLFLMVILCIGGCKACREECDDPTNPDCPNYKVPVTVNPCENKREVSADFTIHQYVTNSGPYVDSIRPIIRNVISNLSILLHAKEDNAQYKWIVGIDTILHQDYHFTINPSFEGSNIDIKLIITKEPDTLCFPTDNGMDTVVKTIHVISQCDISPYGRWYGAWDSAPNDSFVVRFNATDDLNSYGPDCAIKTISGHHQDTNMVSNFNASGLGAEYLIFVSTYGPAYCPAGEVFVSPDHTHVFIKYYMWEYNTSQFGDRILYKFRGRRID